MPTVSVVIPTYNRAKMLTDAVESVLRQTHPVDEIIVIDDGSTDNTPATIEQFGDKLRYIRQANAGPSTARNRGVAEAHGDFIAFQDSDDHWTPNKIATQLDFLSTHPRVEVVFGLMADVHTAADELIPVMRNQFVYDQLRRANGVVENMLGLLLLDNMIPTPTVLMRRACFDRIGGFDPNLHIAEDFDLWLRAAAEFQFGFIDDILLKRRRHEGNLINESATRLHYRLQVLERLPERLGAKLTVSRPDLENQIRALRYDLGSLAFRQGKFRSARENFRRCRAWEGKRVARLFKELVSAMLSFTESPPSRPR